MIRTTLTLAALLLGATPCAALGQAPNRECRDDRGVDRCAAEKQAETRAKFGVPAIEALEAEKAQVMRVFYVDGYGRDMPSIAFARRPGSPPTVSVTVGAAAGETQRAMSAPVPLAVWESLIKNAAFFDRQLVPLPADRDALPICLHAWQVTIESAGIPLGEGRNGIGKITQDACGGGLAIRFAFGLAEEARKLLPGCRELDLDQHRNAIALLAACFQLQGDTVAAATAMNRYKRDWFAYPGEAERGSSIAYLFADPARIEWPGEPAVTGMIAAADLWATKFSTHWRIYPARFIGESADRVRMVGTVMVTAEVPATEPRYARADALWTRENGFDFRLKEMKVSAFQQAQPKLDGPAPR